MNQPLVTIVTPVYNHEKFLNDYFQSIIRQTYENIELILIDDCSPDDSATIIEQNLQKLKERFANVIFIKRSVNKGITYNCNEGLELASGKYFIIFASDDMMLPNRVERNVAFLEENPQYALVHTDGYKVTYDFSFVSGDSYENNESLTEEPHSLPRPDDYFNSLLHKNCVAAPTVCLRTNIVREIGGYSNKYIHEDFYMWLKIAANYSIGYLHEKLVLYRSHPSSFMKNPALTKRMVEDNEKIIMEFSSHINEADITKAKQTNYLKACLLFYDLNHRQYFSEYYRKLNNENKNFRMMLLRILIETNLKNSSTYNMLRILRRKLIK